MPKKDERISTQSVLANEDYQQTPLTVQGDYLDLSKSKQTGYLIQAIEFARQKNNLKVFNFVSTRAGEGVSTIIVSLAKAMAKTNSHNNILVIDANCLHPTLHSVFRIPQSPGLNDVSLRGCAPSESIHTGHSGTIDIMPNGTPHSDTHEGISFHKFSEVISTIKNSYDCIFIDSSPLLVSSSSLSSTIASDTTFLIIHSHKTRWEEAEEAKLHLQKNGGRIEGVILNGLIHVVPDWLYKRL